jgi:hypothetical protein
MSVVIRIDLDALAYQHSYQTLIPNTHTQHSYPTLIPTLRPIFAKHQMDKSPRDAIGTEVTTAESKANSETCAKGTEPKDELQPLPMMYWSWGAQSAYISSTTHTNIPSQGALKQILDISYDVRIKWVFEKDPSTLYLLFVRAEDIWSLLGKSIRVERKQVRFLCICFVFLKKRGWICTYLCVYVLVLYNSADTVIRH